MEVSIKWQKGVESEGDKVYIVYIITEEYEFQDTIVYRRGHYENYRNTRKFKLQSQVKEYYIKNHKQFMEG